MKPPIQKAPSRWFQPFNWFTLSIILAGLFVFLLALVAVLNNTLEFDRLIGKNILTHRHSLLTLIMSALSVLGSTEFLAIANLLLLVFFILRKDKWSAWRVFVVATTSYAIFKTLKALFQRARPDDPIIANLKNLSFPSGHAFMTVAFYGFIICWALVAMKERKPRNAVVMSMLILIIIIGYSRVYLGVHYATDVLAGWGLGTAWLLVGLLVIDKIIAVRHRV